MTKENRQAVEYLVSLANKNQFDLYIVNSPLYEKLYDNTDFQRYYKQVQEKLKKLTDGSDRANVLFANPKLFPIEELENSNHLLHTGARRFSSALAGVISEIEHNR